MALLVNHHSVPGDWNFSSTGWGLDPSVFVSPPSSLRFDKLPGTQMCSIKASVSGIVRKGQLVTQLRRSGAMTFGLTFRAQNPTIYRQSYVCYYEDPLSVWHLYYVNPDGTLREVGSKVYAEVAHNTWYKYRLPFWEAYSYQNIVSLAVRLELFVNGVWTTLTTWYDPFNAHADSATNLVGLWKSGTPALMYFDDTELWVPAA